MNLAQKIAAAMGEIGAVGHDRKNPHHGYGYTSAAAVQARVQKALAKHGIAMGVTLQQEEGSNMHACFVKATVTLTDGESELVSEGFGAGQDKQDKAPMKATTAAIKYALANAFCIALGDDPEADADTDRGGNHVPTFRFGQKLKGQPLTAGDDRAIAYYREAVAKSLDDPDKARWRDDNLRHLAEIDAEIAKRPSMAGRTEAA